MTRKAKLTENISYRLGEEAMAEIQRLADEQGVSVNEWCRQAAIEKARAGSLPPLTGANWLFALELARIRFLLMNVVETAVTGKLSAESWKGLSKEVRTSGPTFMNFWRKLLEGYRRAKSED
jgi:hypothetical protein